MDPKVQKWKEIKKEKEIRVKQEENSGNLRIVLKVEKRGLSVVVVRISNDCDKRKADKLVRPYNHLEVLSAQVSNST